jgi:hypothetical protein
VDEALGMAAKGLGQNLASVVEQAPTRTGLSRVTYTKGAEERPLLHTPCNLIDCWT